MLISETVTCPYCGESQSIQIDPSGGRQQAYEEDCQVCCRPWDVRVRIDGEEAQVRLSAADDVDTDF